MITVWELHLPVRRDIIRANLSVCDAFLQSFCASAQVQSAILKRGLTILKPSGRLLYSTCSMSPIENEAVVAAALEKCLGHSQREVITHIFIMITVSYLVQHLSFHFMSVHLVLSCSPKCLVRDCVFPRFGHQIRLVCVDEWRHAKGLSTWRVPAPDRAGFAFAAPGEVPEGLWCRNGGPLAPTMFPPVDPEDRMGVETRESETKIMKCHEAMTCYDMIMTN